MSAKTKSPLPGRYDLRVFFPHGEVVKLARSMGHKKSAWLSTILAGQVNCSVTKATAIAKACNNRIRATWILGLEAPDEPTGK